MYVVPMLPSYSAVGEEMAEVRTHPSQPVLTFSVPFNYLWRIRRNFRGQEEGGKASCTIASGLILLLDKGPAPLRPSHK